MIPYFQSISFNIGPIPIQVWGLMVSLGIIAALIVIYFLAKKQGLEYKKIPDMGFWIVLMALIGGRVFYILGDFNYFFQNPLDVFKVWEGGMSISGGFVFATITGWLYCRINKLKFLDYVNVCLFGLPLGLGIGRLGCFFVFDHPGKATNFFLGEKYIDGIVRHNHGLYLSIEGFILFIVFLLIYCWGRSRSASTPYLYAIIFLIGDGLTRFILDFYRINDPLFWGLTIAQYLAVLMVIGGIILAVKRKS
ncbi:MAG: prolipoprotein diacylglyceryl transferase [Patescibacteria group bacterium]|jgi:phosphatidylglycerol:prolipoprotein diacylglycerol transferase